MPHEPSPFHCDGRQPGRVVQISVNPNGGVPKHCVLTARLGFNNVEGDKQRNLKYHGGPERALCLYSWEVIRELQDEGHPIDCGTTGENLTIAGIDWSSLRAGLQLQIGGEVLVQLTSETTPCIKVKQNFIDGNFNRVHHKLQPGWSRWYARVLYEGSVHEGDQVAMRDKPTP